MGLAGHVTVTAKQFIQTIWTLNVPNCKTVRKINWDDEVPDQLFTKFSEFSSTLSILNNILVQRHFFYF